jgi:hypothetical protein
MTSRYFVPDLSPIDRPELDWSRARIVFVAESPHVSEIAPDRKSARRPLCGKAGRAWWAALSDVLEGKPNDSVELDRLLALCRNFGVVVLNAVQVPIDSKVTRHVHECVPLDLVGFDKGPGPHAYKKLKNGIAVRKSIRKLAERLNSTELRDLPIVCLGNDSEWFVGQALGGEFSRRVIAKIPHPSAWWRRGGYFGQVAEEKLKLLLTSSVNNPTQH